MNKETVMEEVELLPINPRPGDVLNNGAVVLQYTHIADAGGGMLANGIVLALNSANKVHPFAVWTLIHNEDGSGWSTMSGSYLGEITEAVSEYILKVGDLLNV